MLSGLSDRALFALALFPLKLASLEDGSGVTLEGAKRVHAGMDATSARGLTDLLRRLAPGLHQRSPRSMMRLAALVAFSVLLFAAPAAADLLPPDWKPGDPAPEPALPLPQPKSGCSRRVGGDDALAAILLGASALALASRQRRLRVAR